ncbi:MAG: universal stress protein [cyanobacterium endosymbiont of Rhopalodia musculus]
MITIERLGLKGISKMFFGSVSNDMVHHLHCSVLVI